MSRVALDDRDVRILPVPSREGWNSNTEPAWRVSSPAAPCRGRKRWLERAGLIRGRVGA